MLPIMQGDECIGAFGIARKEPGEFECQADRAAARLLWTRR